MQLNLQPARKKSDSENNYLKIKDYFLAKKEKLMYLCVPI